MQEIVLIIHLLIAIALVIVVLLQRSEGGALGIGGSGGAGGGMFSARGTANALTRATAILAALFMCTSLFLAILAGNTGQSGSVVDSPATQTEQAPQPQAPSEEPQVPLSQ